MKNIIPTLRILLAIGAMSGTLAASTVSSAETKSSQQGMTAEVRPKMKQILDHLVALWPLMGNEQKFSDKKQEKFISGHLAEVQKLVQSVEHEKVAKTPGLQMSRKLLEEELGRIKKSFDGGHKPYARWMLSSTLSLCISCHTQVPSTSTVHWDFSTVKSDSPLADAELKFIARDFDVALGLYHNIVKNYTPQGLKPEELRKAIRREVAIYASVKRDAEGGAQRLSEILQNSKLPKFIHEETKAWVEDFKSWKVKTIPDTSKASAADVVSFAKRELKAVSSAKEPLQGMSVTYLMVAGVLYDFLRAQPESAATPEVLYWLAKCDRATNNQFFYSLADIYLRQCITQYAKTPAAKDCYKEYEEQTILSYTGSSGTRLPDDVKAELKQMKALLE